MANDSNTSEATAEQLAHYRHELRTPVNAIIGYSEMLLEDAEDAPPEFCATLQEVHLIGRALQEDISKFLNSDQLGEAENALEQMIDVARRNLQPSCEQVCADAEVLLGECQQGELESFRADLERIRTAGHMLDNLLQHGVDAPESKTTEEPPAAIPSADTTNHSDIESWPMGQGHVLIVDDNQFNRDMLARGLLRQRLHFALAANGAQALDMLASKSFDVVLLDIMMPVMDGFETLQRIKANEELKHVPVIMISALDQIESVVRCIEMGAEDYLPKPFDPTLLRARVGACLEKKRLRDQELEYLRNVEAVTQAAGAVEAGTFDDNCLDDVAVRNDSLGQLARVFRKMASEVRAREQRLKQQVQQLRVEIDESRKQSQVAEITETDYFQQLQRKAQDLRRRRK